MEVMTAEQAIEAAKGLTFEKVWAALMESRQRMDESQQETQKQMQESNRELKNRMDESWQRIAENMLKLQDNLGGLGNSLGRLTETLFTNELWKKFSDIGFPVTGQSSHRKFCDKKQVLAEADLFIENGEYVIAVEIKTDLLVSDVNEHLERIEIIRQYFDARGDKRKIVGAVAGGFVSENILKYAQRKGLYVVLQTGDSVVIAAAPQGFKAREW
jgi:hypothetical protein